MSSLNASGRYVRINGVKRTWQYGYTFFELEVYGGSTNTSTWTRCASENETCTLSGTQVVAYGANGTFTYKTATNSISCNNATFGDPLVGTYKACYNVGLPG